MATRSISTPDDVEAALLFLSKEKGVTGDQYFMAKVQNIINDVLKEADEKRFTLANTIMSSKEDTGTKISKLRELLGS